MVMVEPGFFYLAFVSSHGVGGCSVSYSTKLGSEMEARSDVGGVVFGVVAVRLFCFLCFGSVTCVVFYNGGGMKFLLPYFCEREGFFDSILDGSGVGGGRWLFQTSVLWPAAADLFSTSVLRKVAADERSSSKLRMGDASGRQFLRLQQYVASLEKIGSGVGLLLASFAMSLELLLAISKFVREFGVASCNFQICQSVFCKVGMSCAIF
jgi:hypothetical protein